MDNSMQKKRKKKIWTKIWILLLTILVCSLTFSMETQAAKKKKKPKIKVTSVKLKNIDSSIILEPGKSKTVKVTVAPSNAANKKVKWTSSKPNVVSVTSKGKIKGLKKGKATITATAKDGSKKKAKLSVTVGKLVSSITFTNTSALTKLPVGKSFKLKTKVLPADAVITSKKWTSSNNKVATVKSGVITAVGNGTTTIKATAKDGSGKYASYKVKVITLAKSVDLANPLKRTYLQKGESVTLQATVKPATTSNKSLTWTSANTKVATVSSKGVVKAVGNGTTSIKVTTKDGTSVSDKFTINVISLRKQDTKFIAHRGYSSVAPENSGAAFREAIAKDFWGVECDVRKTKDGKFVIHHDDSILEDYGENKLISQTNLEELQKLTIISGYGVDVYGNEKMLTLKDFMDIVSTDKEIKIFIELKDYYTQEEIREVIDIINEYQINDRIAIISSKASNMKKLLKVYDEIEKEIQEEIDKEEEIDKGDGAVGEGNTEEGGTEDKPEEGNPSQPDDEPLPEKFVRPQAQFVTGAPDNPVYEYANAVDWCIANKLDICINYNSITQEMVDKMHDANLKVGAYTINNFYTAFVYAKAVGVDTVTTDKVLFN